MRRAASSRVAMDRDRRAFSRFCCSGVVGWSGTARARKPAVRVRTGPTRNRQVDAARQWPRREVRSEAVRSSRSPSPGLEAVSRPRTTHRDQGHRNRTCRLRSRTALASTTPGSCPSPPALKAVQRHIHPRRGHRSGAPCDQTRRRQSTADHFLPGPRASTNEASWPWTRWGCWILESSPHRDSVSICYAGFASVWLLARCDCRYSVLIYLRHPA